MPNLKPARFRVSALLLSLVLFVVMACTSCGTPESTGKNGSKTAHPSSRARTNPRFINHPRPELSIALDAFTDAGCTLDDHSTLVCADDSPLSALECDTIRKPSDLLGGLEPSFPIAVCTVYTKHLAEGEYFYNDGGRRPEYLRYVIYRDDQFQLVRTKDEFRDLYAPIDSANEALSYVLAAKDVSAYYGLERRHDHVYFVDIVQDTHIDTVDDGYQVHLFDYNLFGCGPHITAIVDVHIAFDGTIREIDRFPMSKNPAEDDLCVD